MYKKGIGFGKRIYLDDKSKLDILKNFTSKLVNNMQDIPPEFNKILIDNFWDLI